MTIKEKLIEYMCDNGLFEDDANMVMALYEDIGEPDIVSRLGTDVSGYPDVLMAVVIIGLRDIVVEWIDANKPNHWARGMFIQKKES